MSDTREQVRYRVRQWGGWWYAERHNGTGWQHVYCNPSKERVMTRIAVHSPKKSNEIR